MVIKWIILDVWGVIYQRDFLKEIITPFINNWKSSINKSKIWNLYLEASLGRLSSKEIWNTLGLGQMYPEIENQYIKSHDGILAPDFKQNVKILKKKFRLGIISNDVKEWSQKLLDKFNIKRYFDLIIISGEIKIRKPDKEIFQYFLDISNSIPEECVFVDDRLENLKVAADLGMHPIRFIRRKAKVSFCSEFEVSSFLELLHVLDNFFS